MMYVFILMSGMLIHGDSYSTITVSNSASSSQKKGIFKDRQTCTWLFGSIQAISVLLQVLPGVRSSCLVPASKHHRGCAGELGESESPCASHPALPNTYPHVRVLDWLISHARGVVHDFLNPPLNTSGCSCFWKVHKAHGKECRIFEKRVGKTWNFS